MSSPAAERLGRVSRALWLVVLPALAVGGLKVFVADVYRVDSGSMKPTISGAARGGEAVLVRYVREYEPERFDLVVLLRADEREPLVKRVVGLPGESVLIRDGDLVVDGRKLDPLGPRPPAVPIFDSTRHAIGEHFEFEGEWRVLAGGGIASDGTPARACWRGSLNDDHLDPGGGIVRGRIPVGDVVLECTASLPAASGFLMLSLSEEGDVFELRVEPLADGSAGGGLPTALDMALERRGDGAGANRLASTRVDLGSPGEPVRLRFANIDDALAVDVDGERRLQVAYPSNTPLVGAPDPRLRHRRPRACLTAVELSVELTRVRVLRDLHYTRFGDIGVLSPANLAGDELFCLGDNSAESVDGRTFGPVTLGEVIGMPEAVVWPFESKRWLRPTEGPRPKQR